MYYKKSLGQNFLIDKNIIKKISKNIDLNSNVIEIGPGKCSLTDEILKKKPSSLLLIEKDEKLSNNIKKNYSDNSIVKVLNKDILKVNINKLIKKNSIIVGNLPYNISSQIFIKFIKLNRPLKYKRIIFMFQKELANRIIAKHNEQHYGRISILTNIFLDIKGKFDVSNNCFFPKPKVTSTVLIFSPKPNLIINVKLISKIEKITQIFFSNKRKMINKNLKKIFGDKIPSHFKRKDNLRPVDLTPEEYLIIAKSL